MYEYLLDFLLRVFFQAAKVRERSIAPSNMVPIFLAPEDAATEAMKDDQGAPMNDACSHTKTQHETAHEMLGMLIILFTDVLSRRAEVINGKETNACMPV